MKKLFLFLVLPMLTFSTSVSSAGRYSSLKFTSNTGEIYTVTTNNLEILIQDGNIVFNNTNLIIPLSSLETMEFTDYDGSSSDVDSLQFDSVGSVTVYRLNGTIAGSFDSYAEALDSLSRGIYVIKDENGNSLKVRKEK